MFFIDMTGFDCGGAGVLRIIKFIFILLDVVFFLVPMGLILMMTVDIAKNVIAGRVDDMKKNLNIAIKRLIYCMVLFFVPIIVQFAINLLGDLGVEYADCIEIAQTHDLSQYEINTDYDYNYDGETPNFNKGNGYTVTDNNNNGNGNSSIDVEYSNEVIENLAAFIGSEAGGYPDGFLCQLFTGAVYINNFYNVVNKEITVDTMCEMFSYQSVYTDSYCNFTFDKLEANRGTVPEEHKKQLTIVAKILLSKNFTIPKHVQYQAADYIITNSNATIWAKTSTGLDSYPYGYFGYSNNHAPLVGEDIYGNKVSTNSEDYQKIADDLYNKYVK